MVYLRFKIPEMTSAAATVATFATGSESPWRSVETVASVAGLGCNPDIQGATAAAVASYPTNCGIWDAADFREMYEERAAIMEYDAGMSRAQAEAEAWTDVFCNRPYGRASDPAESR
jgi:hypothetical protein